MTVPYARTPAQRAGDFANARAWEEEVASWLPPHIARFDSTEELDIYVPGAYIDCKEKIRKISDRWPRPPGVEEWDLFIIDELSVRKALRHFPMSYFLIRDRQSGDRVLLARVDEMAAVERSRVNRVGKGKWLVDLSNFKVLEDPKYELWPAITADQLGLPWKRSECQSIKEVPQV